MRGLLTWIRHGGTLTITVTIWLVPIGAIYFPLFPQIEFNCSPTKSTES